MSNKYELDPQGKTRSARFVTVAFEGREEEIDLPERRDDASEPDNEDEEAPAAE